MKNKVKRFFSFKTRFGKPLVSVVVPNYNNEPYIADCLESILDQTYSRIEIVVSDDCSKDQSIDIVRKYVNRYPKTCKAVFNKYNVGVSANRNIGVEQSRGDYITTIDSDDYFFSREKIERELELLIQHRKQGNLMACSFSNAILVNKDKEFIAIRGNPSNLKEGFLLNDFLTRSCEIPINYLIHRSLFKRAGGYNPHIKLYEDWDLKIRIAAFCNFFYTGIIGTAYRRHSDGLSSAQPVEHLHWLNTVFQKNISLVSKEKRRETENGFNNLIENYIERHMKGANKQTKP